MYFTSRLGVCLLHFSLCNKKITWKYDTWSSACIITNSFIETFFITTVRQYIRDFQAISITSPLALLTLFVIDDLLYAPYHRLLHVPFFYRHIHKTHHLQNNPDNGYFDAVSEHPLEMIGALMLHVCAISLARMLQIVPIDKTAVALHIFLKACGAILNHTDREHYFSKKHRIHHKHKKVNYSQHIFLWDYMWNTSREKI
jgi:sterol desaturase/sphingolipid hydroxylase (fatty acid hydroxylase superfamily)